MSVALIVAIVLVVILAVWQTIQIQAVRKKVDAVPDDGNVVALLRAMDDRSKSNSESIQALTRSVKERQIHEALEIQKNARGPIG